MSAKKRTSKALALLLPAGVVGISAALAATQSQAEATIHTAPNNVSVADRLSEIRSEVSSVNDAVFKSPSGAHLLLADWLNGGFGWRNGGWGNGGWHNGGWGNGGWHNGGWGNGGWHNWGNGGWHNWHNFWHNW
jgi:rSAM-associated Gly-rich repeat protein